jgi:farnesyl-diphosphate farnesyltransferase
MEQITADKPCLPPHGPAVKFLIGDLLREVSRSFYLTLRILPASIRPQISVAYLLARASDTIADTEVVPRERRLEILRGMQAGSIHSVTELAEQQALPAERTLLRRLDDCYRMLAELDAADRQLIADLLHIIIGGQIFDLERFPGRPLTDEELDRYTYMVAGCVGEFWTKMCQAHLPGMEALMVEEGIRFGKGLQLVNILRDVGDDQRRGRQYLPRLDELPLWLDRAVEHLDAGWRYTLAIPADQKRLRLACVWPIWIGLKTIARLRRARASERAKVSRWDVYWIMLESSLLAGNDAALDEVYQRLRRAARP